MWGRRKERASEFSGGAGEPHVEDHPFLVLAGAGLDGAVHRLDDGLADTHADGYGLTIVGQHMVVGQLTLEDNPLVLIGQSAARILYQEVEPLPLRLVADGDAALQGVLGADAQQVHDELAEQRCVEGGLDVGRHLGVDTYLYATVGLVQNLAAVRHDELHQVHLDHGDGRHGPVEIGELLQLVHVGEHLVAVLVDVLDEGGTLRVGEGGRFFLQFLAVLVDGLQRTAQGLSDMVDEVLLDFPVFL